MYFTYEGGAPLSVPPKRALANVEARIRRVEADPIEDTINAHYITTLMSAVLSDKARQIGGPFEGRAGSREGRRGRKGA